MNAIIDTYDEVCDHYKLNVYTDTLWCDEVYINPDFVSRVVKSVRSIAEWQSEFSAVIQSLNIDNDILNTAVITCYKFYINDDSVSYFTSEYSDLFYSYINFKDCVKSILNSYEKVQ